MPDQRCHIRWLIRRDMPEVLQIEQASFEVAWTEEDFLRALRSRDCIGMVAEVGGNDYFKVAGFMVYELHTTRLHILNFAVHPEFRRRRVGAQMLAKLQAKLSVHRRRRITLLVSESNLPAQLFFGAQGFRALRVLRGHYADADGADGDDAYHMEYGLPETVEQAAYRLLADVDGGTE